MKHSKVASLPKKHFKTIVVGGGIVGAGIFRDLTLQGVETLLIEARDFSGQTSERSSKLLHGGIRYLENLEFPLVFEALHEKNLWLSIAPHLAREEAFYLPVYKDAKRPLWMIKCGLFLYDLLSQFKNTPFSSKNKNECLKDIPHLKSEGLSGAGVYYDGIMDDAKITLEVIYDALCEIHPKTNHPLSYSLSYTEVLDVKVDYEKNITTLTIKDVLTDEKINVSAEKIVYALGPFTDHFLKQFPFYHWKDSLLPSKGSHIWISKKDLPLEHPIVMTPSDDQGDRVIFVVPHQEKILVGTTEVPNDQNLFSLKPSQSEIEYLLCNLNIYFPQLKLNSSHILSSFSGVRPLAKEDHSDGNRGKASREHKIYRPNSMTYVIVGGKYTTFRVMGREITSDIAHHFYKSYNGDKSLIQLRQPSTVLPFAWKLPTASDLLAIFENEMPRTFSDLVVRRLSIGSKSQWELKTQVNFDEYFNNHLELMQKYISVTTDDIKNFQ